MITARIVNNLSGGIVSSKGFVTLKRGEDFLANWRPWTGNVRPATPLPRAKVIRVASRAPTTQAQRAAAYRRPSEPVKTRAQIRAEGQARLRAARARSNAAMAQKKARRAEKKRQATLRAKRIAASSPPSKNAGVRAWEAYYSRIGREIPSTVKATTERSDQAAFYRAVSGKKYIRKAPGINPRRGVSWMFATAYNGQTMPYWEEWYSKSMSANEIGLLVAADYAREIKRRIAVQAQNRAARELWQDTGKAGPKPIPSQVLMPSAIPQAVTQAPPPSLELPGRAAPPPIPWERGRPFEDLPPFF